VDGQRVSECLERLEEVERMLAQVRGNFADMCTEALPGSPPALVTSSRQVGKFSNRVQAELPVGANADSRFGCSSQANADSRFDTAGSSSAWARGDSALAPGIAPLLTRNNVRKWANIDRPGLVDQVILEAQASPSASEETPAASKAIKVTEQVVAVGDGKNMPDLLGVPDGATAQNNIAQEGEQYARSGNLNNRRVPRQEVYMRRTCFGMMYMPILHPESSIRVFWILFGLIFITFEIFAIPFYIAFNIDPQLGDGLFVWGSVINIYFLLDILLTFMTGHVDGRTGMLMLSPKKIAVLYLKS